MVTLIVSSKIAEMFKTPGFVNVDYLLLNRIYVSPSRILDILTKEWRKRFRPEAFENGLDPNFGYETPGSSGYSALNDDVKGSLFTCPDVGTANSITASMLYRNVNEEAQCAIYKHSDLSLTGDTEAKVITTGVQTWWTFNIESGGSLANDDYVLCGWGDYNSTGGGGYINLYYDTGATDQGHKADVTYNAPNPAFPNPITFTIHDTKKFSIYCSYTVTAGIASKRLLRGVGI